MNRKNDILRSGDWLAIVYHCFLGKEGDGCRVFSAQTEMPRSEGGAKTGKEIIRCGIDWQSTNTVVDHKHLTQRKLTGRAADQMILEDIPTPR